MPNLAIFLILSFFIALIDAEIVEFELDYKGGLGDFGYACSKGVGKWNHGRRYIPNKIPANSNITSISVTLKGYWGCDGQDSRIKVSLQGHEIGSVTLSEACIFGMHQEVTLEWAGTEFSGYDYSIGTNEVLKIKAIYGITCLNKVIVKITYAQPPDNAILPIYYNPFLYNMFTYWCALGYEIFDLFRIINLY